MAQFDQEEIVHLPLRVKIGLGYVQVRQFRRVVSLAEMKRHKEDALKGLALLHISRLSVMPITKQHFDFICDLEDSESEG